MPLPLLIARYLYPAYKMIVGKWVGKLHRASAL
jgi:hypothetical protein